MNTLQERGRLNNNSIPSAVQHKMHENNIATVPLPASTYNPSAFHEAIAQQCPTGLRAAKHLTTLQLNVGLKCNLTCRHCHVNSSPKRKEEMDWPTMLAALQLAQDLGMTKLDLTGGAPEMNPHIKRLIHQATKQRMSITLRTNLTIHLEPGYEDFIPFFKEHRVALVASLPCYIEDNVNQQRGEGVYQDSIEVLRTLNEAGYGIESHLPLHLVYNPVGPSLPPAQDTLESEYRQKLLEQYGLHFTSLLTITNVPIGRFKTDLRKAKQLDNYLSKIGRAHV